MNKTIAKTDIMKNTVTKADLEQLAEVNESVKGTHAFRKYYMMMECKYRTESGKWSAWKFMGWNVPTPADMKVKKIGNNVYLIRETNIDHEETVTRYTLTEACNEVLKVLDID